MANTDRPTMPINADAAIRRIIVGCDPADLRDLCNEYADISRDSETLGDITYNRDIADALWRLARAAEYYIERTT